MAYKYVLPHAPGVIRALILQGIQDRRNGMNTYVDLGTVREQARRALDPGSYDLLEVAEPERVNTDLSFTLSRG